LLVCVCVCVYVCVCVCVCVCVFCFFHGVQPAVGAFVFICVCSLIICMWGQVHSSSVHLALQRHDPYLVPCASPSRTRTRVFMLHPPRPRTMVTAWMRLAVVSPHPHGHQSPLGKTPASPDPPSSPTATRPRRRRNGCAPRTHTQANTHGTHTTHHTSTRVTPSDHHHHHHHCCHTRPSRQCICTFHAL